MSVWIFYQSTSLKCVLVILMVFKLGSLYFSKLFPSPEQMTYLKRSAQLMVTVHSKLTAQNSDF